MPSELSQCITSEQWTRCLEICNHRAADAKQWSCREGFFEGIKKADVLPLHEACANTAPYEVVAAMVACYPEGVYSYESAYRRLPIHIACRKNADVRVIQLLLQYYANGSLEPDLLGRLPLHYALSNGAQDDVVQALLDCKPDSARGTDKRGWLPLHVACSVGASTNVISRILKAYPEGVITKTNKGTSAERAMDSHMAQNKDEVMKLLLQFKSIADSGLGTLARQPSSERMLV
jgi:hypothetical protein